MPQLKTAEELAIERAYQRSKLPNPYEPKSDLIVTGSQANSAFRDMKRSAVKKKTGLEALPKEERTEIERKIKRRAQSGSVIDSVFEAFHSPFRLRYTIEQPTERKEINDWFRYYYKNEPIVGSAIDMHVEYPLSTFQVEHEDKGIEDFFNEQIEENNIFELIVSMVREWYTVGECLVPGTMITLGNQTTVPIESIIPGDFVITHKGRPKRVTSLMQKMVEEDIYKIKYRGIFNPVEITGNHPIFAYRRKECYMPSCRGVCKPNKPCYMKKNCKKKPEWKLEEIKAKDIGVGDYMAFPIDRKVIDLPEMTKKKARFLGCYLSEGCLDINRVMIGNKDPEFVKQVVDCWQDSYPEKTVSVLNRKDGCMMINGYSKEVTEQVREWCGELSKTKKLSKEIVYMHPDYQLELLKGCIEGDGWVDRSTGRICISTTSYDLACQLRMLLLRNDIPSSLVLRDKITQSSTIPRLNGMRCKIYYVDISSNHVDKLRVGLLKQEGFRDPIHPGSGSRMFIYGDSLLTPITKIEKKKYKGPVYNLSVEEDESYVANFAAVHNCFPFGFFDDAEDPTCWDGFILLDPNYIKINTHRMVRGRNNYQIRLVPDEDLKKIVNNGPNDKATGELYKHLNEDIIQSAKADQPLPLNPLQISHFKRITNPFNVRGESIISRCLDTLMYRDKLREAQYATADRHTTPKEFYMIGTDEQPADDLELSNFQNLLAQSWTNPNQAIVYHHALRIEWQGASGKILPLQGEFELIERWLLAALSTNRTFIDGTGPTYANASVAMDVMISKYMTVRLLIESWLNNHFFRPLCEIHDIYVPIAKEVNHKYRVKGRKRKPWFPNYKWVKSNLRDDAARIQLLERLVSMQPPLASRRMLQRAANIDPKIADKEIEEERKEDLEKGVVPAGGEGLPAGIEAPFDEGAGAPYFEGSLPEEGLGGELGGGIDEELPFESPLEGGNLQMPPESSRKIEMPVSL